nr:hypothetical protein [Tanacetum cinerariifolium]
LGCLFVLGRWMEGSMESWVRWWSGENGEEQIGGKKDIKEKSLSALKRTLEKVVKSSQAGTSHSHSSLDSLGFGTNFSTLDFMNSSDSVSKIVSRCSSPILRKSPGSTVAHDHQAHFGYLRVD